MGKKSSSSIRQYVDPNSPAGIYAREQSEWQAYKLDNEGTDLDFDQWKSWQTMLKDYTPPVVPTYELKEFDQLPITPQGGVQLPPLAGQNGVINKYLEEAMRNAERPTSETSTEVVKALRAAAPATPAGE